MRHLNGGAPNLVTEKATLTNPTHAAALEYAARGWHVFPVWRHTKRPACENGLHDATTDPEQIAKWWAHSDHGIAIATGPRSGIWIVDVDIDNVQGKTGDVTLQNLERDNGPLPDTLTQLTPRGGQHLVYRWDDAHPVRNNQSGKIGRDLDVRGDGGYFLAAPSVVHYSDRDLTGSYSWDVGQPDEPADAPAWLSELACWTPPPVVPRIGPKPDDRPGDLWAAVTDWAQILEPDGWTFSHAGRNGERHWVRPGKALRDGTSATTGFTENDNLKVFTSSMVGQGLDAEGLYSKLGYLAATRFGGDHSAAAGWCRSAGFGETVELGDLMAAPVEPVELPPLAPVTLADDEWPELLPIEKPKNLPPWPVHVLPAWMSDHILSSSDQLQTPVDLCAQFALGAVAAVAMGHTRVVIGKWSEPLNLYLATALSSGGGKSPAEKAMTSPVRKWENDRREASLAAVSESVARRAVLEAKAKAAEKGATLGSVPLSEAIDARIELDTHEVVHPFRRLADDATPEKLTQLIAEQRGLMAVLSTEAALMDMAAGGYAGKAGPNINVYLKAYSGDPLMVDRKGSANTGPTELRIAEPLLTVGLAMQPSVIDFTGATNGQLEGRGFFARFLYSCPKPTIGTRQRSRVLDAPDNTHADVYAAKLIEYAERWSWPVPDMTMTPAAAQRFVDHLDAQEPEMIDGYAPISEWMAKLQSSILRVAGILHLVHDRPASEPVEPWAIEAAIELGEYWIAHALAMSAGADDNGVIDNAKAILAYIDRKAITEAKPRDFYLGMRSRFRNVEDTIAPLQHLETCGYLKVVQGSWENVGSHGGVCKLLARPRDSRDCERNDMRSEPVARVARGSLIGMSSEVHPLTNLSTEPPRDSRDWDSDDEPSEPVDNSTQTANYTTDPEEITWI